MFAGNFTGLLRSIRSPTEVKLSKKFLLEFVFTRNPAEESISYFLVDWVATLLFLDSKFTWTNYHFSNAKFGSAMKSWPMTKFYPLDLTARFMTEP